MDYLKDVDDMFHTLQGLYPNPNSLKAYNNVLTVITFHFKDFNKVHQQLTRIGKEINKRIQEKRDDNVLEDDDKERIILLDKPTI